MSYEELLNFYFHNIDPTRDDGQFCDDGNQYRPVIFYSDDRQKTLAEEYRQNLIDSKKFPTVRVQILPAQTFYPAEDYHQEYYQKILSGTNTTATIAAATSASKNFGELQTFEPTPVKFFVDFRDYFGRFSIQIRGVISTFVYYPPNLIENGLKRT